MILVAETLEFGASGTLRAAVDPNNTPMATSCPQAIQAAVTVHWDCALL